MTVAHIVCGLPAAGKSTYGKGLAARLNAAFIDIDTATERLVRLALRLSGSDPDDRDSPGFKQRFREPIYEQMFDIARENLTHVDVVLAGPFTSEIRDPAWLTVMETRLGARVKIHYVRCRPDIRRQRMIERNNPRDAAKFDHWDELTAYYRDEAPPVFDHILIDTSKPKETYDENASFRK